MAGRHFEILDHPADIGFRVNAPELPELYVAAALAMLSIAAEPDVAAAANQYAIQVESVDREALMVDWLNEVLFWFDGKRIALRDFRVTAFTEGPPAMLSAIALGESRDRERHRARLIVKGVTYHQLRVERRGPLWTAEVYLDV